MNSSKYVDIFKIKLIKQMEYIYSNEDGNFYGNIWYHIVVQKNVNYYFKKEKFKNLEWSRNSLNLNLKENLLDTF